MEELGLVNELVLQAPEHPRRLFLGTAPVLEAEDTNVLRVHFFSNIVLRVLNAMISAKIFE